MSATTVLPKRGSRSAVGGRRVGYLRRAAWVLVLAVAGLAAGFALGSPLGARSVGQAVVLVQPLPGNAFADRNGNTLVDLKTDSQLALSDTVLERVAAARGERGPAPESMRSRLDVRLVDGAEVIVISFRGEGPAQAMDVAQRVAETMLELRAEKAAATSAERVAALEAALAAAEKRLVAAAENGERAARVPILTQRIVSLRNQLRSLTEAGTSAGSVLATSAPRQPGARKIRVALAGAGVLVGSSVGLWLGSRARRRARGGRAW